MIKDVYSSSACATGALATLKGNKPKTINVDKSNRIPVSYYESDGLVYCCCNSFKAYAKITDKDFSVFINNNVYDFVSENSELLKYILTSAAKIMKDIPGAELYIIEEN